MMHWVPFLGRALPTVSVVRLNGIIAARSVSSGVNLLKMARPLEQAFSQKGLKAVALDINSPGGSPVQSALLYRRIRALASEKEIPVVSFAQDVAASGGYWLACAGDEIFADANSIVGSIGVISGSFGLQSLMERIGIERRLHTAGDRKAFLDPFLPEKDRDVARLKALQSDMHDNFKQLVRTRREGKLKAPEDILFSGEFWTGGRALELGLLDGLGDLREIMRQRYGKKVRFRVFGHDSSWFRRRLGLGLTSRGADSWADQVLASVESRGGWL